MVHRLHGVGQHHRMKAALEALLDHLDDLRVHERLAAGKPDLACTASVALDRIEIGPDFFKRDVGKAVVTRGRLDIAVSAGDIAERSRVELKRIQLPKATRANGSSAAA